MFPLNRFQRELARLGDASAELQEKSAALNEVESVLSREKKAVQQLTNEVGVPCNSVPFFGHRVGVVLCFCLLKMFAESL